MNPPPSTDVERHLLRRCIAYSVDASISIAVLCVNFVVILAGMLVSPSPDELTGTAVVMNLVSLLCTSVVGFGYFLARDALPGGASVGKRLAGLRVLVAESGEPCTLGRSCARNAVLLGFGAIDLVIPFIRANGRRLGDDIAGTMVVGRVAPP